MVDIGGVEVLKNSQTGVISYYNSVVGVADCNGWNGVKNEASIGGVHVDFHKKGYYQFSYILEPWKGRFAQLEGGQIVVFKTLDITTQNTVSKKDVERYAYSYSSSQEIVFNIEEPGSYTIGFGPYGGTLLSHSLAIDGDHLNATSIRFKLEPLDSANNAKDSGASNFEFNTFVDLSFKESEDQKAYIVEPLIKNSDYMSAPKLSLNYMKLVKNIPGISQKNIAAIVDGYKNAQRVGYSTIHPYGLNAEFATRQLQVLNRILEHSEFGWNDAEIKKVTATKIAHYLWRITGRNQDTINRLNHILKSNDYQTLTTQAIKAVQDYLSAHFPQYQNI